MIQIYNMLTECWLFGVENLNHTKTLPCSGSNVTLRFTNIHSISIPEKEESHCQKPTKTETIYFNSPCGRCLRTYYSNHVSTWDRSGFKATSHFILIVPKPQGDINFEQNCGLEYQISHQICNTVYVGETERNVGTRKRERVDPVKICNTKKITTQSTSYGFQS